MHKRCRDAWTKSSVEERRYLTSVACNAVVLYLRIADQMLAARSKKAEEKEGRARFRLEGLEWGMEHPRLLLISTAVCEADDTMDFILGLCLDEDECLELVQQAKCGRVGFDAESATLVSGRSSTWEDHARDFWSLVVHDISLHMEAAGARPRAFGNVKAALAKPVSRSTRSWPNKKSFAQLKESWERLDVEERVRMTALSPNEYWFIQACDLSLASSTMLACKRSGLGLDLPVLKALRERSRIVASLDVNVDSVVRVMLNAEFVMDPRCLDELYKKSVQHVTDKTELVRMALCCRYDGLVEATSSALVADSSCTWADVERVVATLVLECMLQRVELMTKAASFVTQHREDVARKAQEAAQRKREKQKEKRRQVRNMSLALEKAERDREIAELARQKAEETRTSAELERLRAEEVRASQEEARVAAEVERRLYEAARRKEERQKTLEMLSKAPSWDISFLSVTRTFLDYRESETPTFHIKDW